MPVSQVNEYDLLFEKMSDGPEEIDGIVKDFLDDVYTDEVEGRPGLYIKERAAAVMHLHVGEVIAGFTSTFEFEDGAEGVSMVAWKDRREAAVWLEMQCSGTNTVFRYPEDKADWVAREVWVNARLLARDSPDVFQRLMGNYDDLDVEDITDVTALPEGNPDIVDSEKDDSENNGADEKVLSLSFPALSLTVSPFTTSSFPTTRNFKSKISPLDGFFMKKEKSTPVDAKTTAVISSMMKASERGKVAVTDGTGFCEIVGLRVVRPPLMDERPGRKRLGKTVSELSPAVPQGMRVVEPSVVDRPAGVLAKRTLRLTFISKSGRLNVENMETGSQWRADSSGLRIEEESVGHVTSRRIEDTDFTMTTSAGQIVLRDDSCGYEFTIRLG